MKKKLTFRFLTLLLALTMLLPGMPIFAEESGSATPGTDASEPPAAGDTETPPAGEDTATPPAGEGTTTPPTGEGDDTPGTTTKPEDEGFKLPEYDEETERIPDPFEFEDDMWYLAYKNTSTYSLVRSKNAMVVVKAKLLELQQTFFDLTAEDPTLANQIRQNKVTLTTEQRDSYESRMGALLPMVEDASKLTKNEIIIAQYDWDTKQDLTGRADVGAMAKKLITSASDFFIHVTENGDVWCVGGANTTTVIAFDYMMDRILKIDREQRYIAIEKGLTYVYHHEERNDIPFAITNKGETSFEFTLQAYSMDKDMFCRLTYNGNNGWRLQDKQVYSADYSNMGAAQLLATTVGESTALHAEKLTYTENGNQLTITAPDGSYVIVNTTNGQIEFYTKSGKLAQKLLGATHTVYHGMHTVTATFELDPEDVIYGSGGQFKEMNLNGLAVTLYTNDVFDSASSVYTVVPLFVNTKGHGVFMNRNEYMTVDIGKKVETEMTFTVTNGSLDVYVFTTESIADVIKQYSEISGFAGLPADWSYGMLVCRYNKEFDNLEGVYEMIAKMEKYGLAWSGVILEDWNIYSKSKHADLKTLCDYLHSMGKKVIVYVRAGNMPDTYENRSFLLSYTDANKSTKDQLPSNLTGEFLDEKDHELISTSEYLYYIDLTNPEAVDWFFNTYWDMLLNEIGVDGVKIDRGGLIIDTVGTMKFYDANMATAGTHHWYASSFNTLVWEAISSKPDGGICYANTAGIGAQRAPYMWAGDQSTMKNRLQRQLNYVLTAGLSGIPFVSYDMGSSSYTTDENGKPEKMDIKDEAEFFLRALEMTVFMPSMQTSGTIRRPYDYAEEDAEYAYVTQLYKLYTKLHEALIPYFEECSLLATETGMPVVRHMVLNYSGDEAVYEIKNQFMLGDAFLVAPELELKSKRNIYLPAGEWLDLNTGETFEGGQTISYKVSEAQVPVFYNMNTTSETAAEILSSVQGALELINAVELP